MAVNDEFRRKFAAFVQRAKDNQEIVVRKVGLDLMTSLVLKSPVDTGRFRGNWQVQYNLAPSTVPTLDKSGGPTIAAANGALQTVVIGQTFYLVNHLPYAQRLEYGWSKQAPAGMVRLTLSEYDAYLTRVVGDLKK
ncbi:MULTISPECIES: HK97 gp10 family phage protein [unclassified Cupriavidus]|uniref:HK97 gp10 family phage protein n=1 Tax=unclassified Cupriavidus TaxID=2640874 RepID=UPI00313E9ACF